MGIGFRNRADGNGYAPPVCVLSELIGFHVFYECFIDNNSLLGQFALQQIRHAQHWKIRKFLFNRLLKTVHIEVLPNSQSAVSAPNLFADQPGISNSSERSTRPS